MLDDERSRFGLPEVDLRPQPPQPCTMGDPVPPPPPPPPPPPENDGPGG